MRAIKLTRSARHPVGAAVLGCGAALAWYGWTYGFLPEGASTVSLLHASDVFRQGSRHTPEPDGAYWIPSASQIRAIELALPEMARKIPKRNVDERAEQFHSLHQYIGYTLKGKRLIYVNVVPDDWRYAIEHLAPQGYEPMPSEVVQHAIETVLPGQATGTGDGHRRRGRDVLGRGLGSGQRRIPAVGVEWIMSAIRAG